MVRSCLVNLLSRFEQIKFLRSVKVALSALCLEIKTNCDHGVSFCLWTKCGHLLRSSYDVSENYRRSPADSQIPLPRGPQRPVQSRRLRGPRSLPPQSSPNRSRFVRRSPVEASEQPEASTPLVRGPVGLRDIVPRVMHSRIRLSGGHEGPLRPAWPRSRGRSSCPIRSIGSVHGPYGLDFEFPRDGPAQVSVDTVEV